MILVRTSLQAVLLVVGFLAFLAQAAVISKFILLHNVFDILDASLFLFFTSPFTFHPHTYLSPDRDVSDIHANRGRVNLRGRKSLHSLRAGIQCTNIISQLTTSLFLPTTSSLVVSPPQLSPSHCVLPTDNSKLCRLIMSLRLPLRSAVPQMSPIALALPRRLRS